MTLPVAILAGGKGTRLGDLTQYRPKSLVPVAGKPFILHQLDLLKKAGLNRVVVLVGHYGKMIEEELQSVTGMDILVLYDWPQLVGTAAAIRAAVPHLGSEFFVLYGDSYLDCDYRKIEAEFLRHQDPALMVVCEDETHPNAQFAGGYVLHYDKIRPTQWMHHIDYGLSLWRDYVMRHSFEFDLADLMHRTADARCLAGYEWPERYLSIGSPEGLAMTEEFILSRTAHASK